MPLWNVSPLPDEPLAAAARFHAEELPRIAADRSASLVIVFPPADHAHAGWRKSVVQSLARERAPLRVNGVASDSEAAIAAAGDYLDGAPGVTGQYWALDANGAAAA